MKETIYKRIFVIVLDSLGIGAMPDSEKFGDRDVDTFGHILRQNGNTGDSKSSEAWYAESAYRGKDVWNRESGWKNYQTERGE
mgnify:CR=1 FL=1